ncbi:hypothetical protein EI94DRAFT_1327446 [Lactarius quietus]|nr:hypothetical protein EI94DRAFT_1327446 [Lactarius quietus]
MPTEGDRYQFRRKFCRPMCSNSVGMAGDDVGSSALRRSFNLCRRNVGLELVEAISGPSWCWLGARWMRRCRTHYRSELEYTVNWTQVYVYLENTSFSFFRNEKCILREVKSKTSRRRMIMMRCGEKIQPEIQTDGRLGKLGQIRDPARL